MTIRQAMCSSFKTELLRGIHDFTTSTGDTFKMALYSASADLNDATTAYTTSGEITGTGYTAGGITLSQVTPALVGSTAVVTFATATWPAATFSARGALIYNATESNRAVMVLDFGSVRSVSASTFTVAFPTADAYNAIIQVA